MEKFIKKLIILFVGLTIMSFGITLYLKAGFGADPITTFTSGVSKALDVSIGKASMISMSFLMLIILLIDRKRIGIGTFANTFLTGVFLDLFMKIDMNTSSTIFRLFLLLAGVLCFAIGLAMFIISELGEGPVDVLMLIFKDSKDIGIERARLVTDTVLIILGFLMGANIGIGTIAGTFFTGIIMGRTIVAFQKYKFI